MRPVAITVELTGSCLAMKISKLVIVLAVSLVVVTAAIVLITSFGLASINHEHEVRHFGTLGVFAVAFSPDGKYALSANDDRTIRLWNVDTGEEVRRFVGHDDKVNSVAFSPEGKSLLTASDDSTIRLWDVATGTEIRSFRGHELNVNSARFSPDGRYALSAGLDDTVRLWDLKTGAEIRRFEGYTHTGRFANSGHEASDAAFSPDGRLIAAAYDDGLVLWNAQTAEKVHQFFECAWAYYVEFSSDGHYLTTGDQGALRFWDVQSYREVRHIELNGYSGYKFSLSSDGHFLLSRTQERAAGVWDLQTGRQIAAFYGQKPDDFTSFAISPDARLALTGTKEWEVDPQNDGSMQLWRLP
jgi:WD40 repeat protein